MSQGKIITIRENQLRRIFEGVSRLDESLSERIFHFTSLRAAYNILHNDEMFCQSALAGSGADDYSKTKKFYISFSRNKSPYEGFGSKTDKCVRFEFDGRLLNQNFEGKPINYWGGEYLNNKYSYARRASGLSDFYTYGPLKELPQGAEAQKVKKMPHATAYSPQYIELNGNYEEKLHHKNDVDKETEYQYKPYNGEISDTKEVGDYEFKYPKSFYPQYVAHDGKTYKLERVVPSDLAKHVYNEFEDRLFTSKSVIPNIHQYIKRVDILIEDFDKLSDGEKRYAYALSMKGKCFIYGNTEDYLAQNTNTINKQIHDIEGAYDKYGQVFAYKDSYLIDLLANFFKAMTTTAANDKEKYSFISNTLKKYSFESLTNAVIKKMNNLWNNYKDCLDIVSSEIQNNFKRPSKNGQIALQMLTDVMSDKGYSNWRDAIKKIEAEIEEKYGHGRSTKGYVDYYTPKTLIILTYDRKNFNITDSSKSDFWYIFEMHSLQSRYTFINELIEDLQNEYYNSTWRDAIRDQNVAKFKRYLQHLAHKNVSLNEMMGIFNKLGVDIGNISTLGYPKIEEKTMDYWEFTSKCVLPPYKPQINAKSASDWEICDKYAEEVYKKSEA